MPIFQCSVLCAVVSLNILNHSMEETCENFHFRVEETAFGSHNSCRRAVYEPRPSGHRPGSLGNASLQASTQRPWALTYVRLPFPRLTTCSVRPSCSVTRDPNRFPSEIVEAQCRHSGCINAEGQEDSSMNSVPIQQEFLVLRREPQGCSRSFRLEKVRVTVGCTCVTPIVRYVSA